MMNRREFMAAAAAAQLTAFSHLGAEDSGTVSSDLQVPPFDPSRLHPADFSDADLDMPHNLAWLPRIANSVESDGPNRGFINTSVWSGPDQLHPYNSRIMESVLTLAWFYASPRKWNQFYSSKPLRARLELALEYWCNLQSPDGKFSEHGPQQWSLDATSSALKFMAETLRLLKTGPPITSGLHARVVDGCRKALHATLFDSDLIVEGKSNSTQYTSVFAGGATFLSMYPEPKLYDSLKEQVEFSTTNLQSLCGYLYDADGPDLGSCLAAQHENLGIAYHYWRGTHLGERLIQLGNTFGKWLSYNLLPEPGQPIWSANCGIDTRQLHTFFPGLETPLADKAPILRAFADPSDRRAQLIRAARDKMEAAWPRVEALDADRPETLSPARFLGRADYDWHPSDEQIGDARKMLRPVNESSFVEQMMDTRQPMAFTFLRRPNYYAAFAAAPKPLSDQQRLGLTFVWSPLSGVLLQSQSGGTETAWGTLLGGQLPVETSGLLAHLADDNETITYSLPDGGVKTLRFAIDRIHVKVERGGDIVEHLPVFDPTVVFSPSQYSMHPAPVRITGPRPAACPNPNEPCAEVTGPVPGKTLFDIELTANGLLEYEIRPAV